MTTESTSSDTPSVTGLREEICESFVVRPDGDRRWVVRSPFLYDDGDGLPVVLRSIEDGGWLLTDEGITVSHLFFDEFQFTPSRFGRLTAVASLHGATMTAEHAVEFNLNGRPSPYDIADFLQAIIQLQGVARSLHQDRDLSRYSAAVRSEVKVRMQAPDYDENWFPPELRNRTKGTYRADMRLTADDGRDVVLFAASTSERASVSALSVHQFKRIRGDVIPVLAYHPDRVGSEAVFRFQDEVDDDLATIAVEPGSIGALVVGLQTRGVAIE